MTTTRKLHEHPSSWDDCIGMRRRRTPPRILRSARMVIGDIVTLFLFGLLVVLGFAAIVAGIPMLLEWLP